jgi:hypothetical protein
MVWDFVKVKVMRVMMGTTVGEGGGEIVLGQLFLDRLGKRTCVIAIKTFYPHIFANIYGFVIQNLTEYIHCTC